MTDGIRETTQKVEVSLLAAIERHVQSHSENQGLDFLDTKMLLSYLIDLVVYLRNRKLKHNSNDNESNPNANNRNVSPHNDSSNLQRLTEMKVALDKLRILDKKLRYQIDKLLAGATSSTSFAVAGSTNASSNMHAAVDADPLEYRPNADALGDDDDDDDEEASSQNGDDDDDYDEEESNKQQKEQEDGSLDGSNSGRYEDGEEEGDDDADKAAARLRLTTEKKNKKEEGSSSSLPGSKSDNLYRAPRLSAVPYSDNNKQDKQVEREKRQRRRLKASEIALTLRSQLGEAPEQEDAHGGAELGRQREAARRLAEMEKEKTRYEEEAMVRLTRTRMEKKQQKRLMREETSNLSAIADLGNLVRGLEPSHRKMRTSDGDDGFEEGSRYENGKRKRHVVDKNGRSIGVNKKTRSFKPKSSVQAALYGQGGGKKVKKHKK